MVAQFRALQPFGLIRPGQTVGSLDLLDASKLLSANEVEGVLVAAPGYLVAPSTEAVAWTTRFEKRFGWIPTYTAAYAYDMGTTLLLAAAEVNASSASNWQAEFLSALRRSSFEGITGRIAFNEDQSLKTALVLSTFRDGVARPI